MNFKSLAMAVGLTAAAVAGPAGVASAATTFTFDNTSSTISLNGVDGCAGLFFTPANCSLNADFAGPVSWTGGAVGDSVTINNFIDWTVALSGWKPTGGGAYDVAANLVFSAPSMASGSASGDAAFGVLLGKLSAGGLIWDNGGMGTIHFAGGRALDFDLHNQFAVGAGQHTTSGVTFTVSAVPLPAGAVLLLGAFGGLGGLGAMRRRRKAA